jgi:23S rRNA pseudouridine2605 synthase
MLERLQKIISRAGIASRRHAEQLMESGQVRVNGRVVTELGAKADPGRDRIEAAGRLVELPANNVYLALHKPARVVATLSDPEGRPSLRDLLRGLDRRVFPVGRLDYAASGLLLLTNDGAWANRMMHAVGLTQTYWFKVKGRLDEEMFGRLQARLRTRPRMLRPPRAAREAANPWYEVKLRDASRDRLRRTLFEAGHPVEKLRRVAIGPVELRDLREGQLRALNGTELSRLRQVLARVEAPHRGTSAAARGKGFGRKPERQ